jgi:hypothetical protein
MGLQFLMSEEADDLRRQIILALTEDDRLHTEEVKRLWDMVKGELKPDRMLNEAWRALVKFGAARTVEAFPALANYQL